MIMSWSRPLHIVQLACIKLQPCPLLFFFNIACLIYFLLEHIHIAYTETHIIWSCHLSFQISNVLKERLDWCKLMIISSTSKISRWNIWDEIITFWLLSELSIHFTKSQPLLLILYNPTILCLIFDNLLCNN